MRKLLESLSKDTLIDFLVEYSKDDTDFANAVNVRFGEIDFSNELKKIERTIDIGLRNIGDYHYNGGWGYIDFDTSKIENEIAERIKQGHLRLAFAECSLLYRKYLVVFEYQEECEIADEAEATLEMMSDIASKITDSEDGDYIFNECIALCDVDDGKDYGADYEDKLLMIASKFVTKENAAELTAVIEQHCTGWRSEEFKLVQLGIVKKIKGQKAADAFINENLKHDKFREMAYETALKNSDYNLAEELCIGGIPEEEPRQCYYRATQWLYKLFFVYETLGNIEKMSETAESILLYGDLQYYDILKSLLKKQKLWEKRYSELLKKCEKSLNYPGYAELLVKEKEYTLLFELAKIHTDLVYEYGKQLCNSFRQETLEIFLLKLNKQVASATNRKEYQAVCRNISTFKSAGYVTEANDMITGFKQTYKKRPAFIDELGKI